ncbi:uncharacterized protein H6S33_001374 [Morchella sextelata]|uniref:uncharacterized protein n=1 Tax=Morchella sextelata TaxID=1174677 RepID=UPI001D050885|nr:uncharacterized protein H6S33_001374 [Morchella sextelata]KAH0609146.1 hypothetical protein H6S33_001374 [Morchella sextelata]
MVQRGARLGTKVIRKQGQGRAAPISKPSENAYQRALPASQRALPASQRAPTSALSQNASQRALLAFQRAPPVPTQSRPSEPVYYSHDYNSSTRHIDLSSMRSQYGESLPTYWPYRSSPPIDGIGESFLNLDLNVARAAPTPTASVPVAAAPPAATVPAFRSEKFPDPKKFDGTHTKLPGFTTQLRMKLEVNHDRFRNEAAKIIYAVSRLEGRALDQVVPLINANPAAPFSSVTAFVAHLEASFGDTDPRGTTRRQLVALKQGKGDFATYYSQFLRIYPYCEFLYRSLLHSSYPAEYSLLNPLRVAYLNYNEGAKIDALAEGLSEDLKDAMTYRTDRPNTVEACVTMLMTIENQVRGRKVEQRAIRNTMGQFTAPAAVAHLFHTTGGLAPMDLSALQVRPAQRSTIEQRYTFVKGQRKTSAAEK